jgi:hypothetical protein
MPVRTIRSHRGGTDRRSGNVFRLDRTLAELIMDGSDSIETEGTRLTEQRDIYQCNYCNQEAVTLFTYKRIDCPKIEKLVCQEHLDWLDDEYYGNTDAEEELN